MRAEAPVSRFPVPKLSELPDDIRARIDLVQEKAGFVPNIFLALAHRPDEFRAFMAYHDALMDRPGGLTKTEREMIVVATSAANDCLYCVIAHGAILRVRAKNPLIADQIALPRSPIAVSTWPGRSMKNLTMLPSQSWIATSRSHSSPAWMERHSFPPRSPTASRMRSGSLM